MSWDERPLIGEADPQESQQLDREASGQLSPNHSNNCGPAVYAMVMAWLGNGDPHEPGEIAGPGYLGPMSTAHIWSFFLVNRKDYPAWADIVVLQGDVVTLAGLAAKNDYPMVCWFWSDGNAVIQPRVTGIRHWCAIVADDGGHLVLRNPEWGTDVTLTYAEARAAFAGEFTVFQRSLMASLQEIYDELRGGAGRSKLDRLLSKLDGPHAPDNFESSALWDGSGKKDKLTQALEAIAALQTQLTAISIAPDPDVQKVLAKLDTLSSGTADPQVLAGINDIKVMLRTGLKAG
jgi:hypothetical protein